MVPGHQEQSSASLTGQSANVKFLFSIQYCNSLSINHYTSHESMNFVIQQSNSLYRQKPHMSQGWLCIRDQDYGCLPLQCIAIQLVTRYLRNLILQWLINVFPKGEHSILKNAQNHSYKGGRSHSVTTSVTFKVITSIYY